MACETEKPVVTTSNPRRSSRSKAKSKVKVTAKPKPKPKPGPKVTTVTKISADVHAVDGVCGRGAEDAIAVEEVDDVKKPSPMRGRIFPDFNEVRRVHTILPCPSVRLSVLILSYLNYTALYLSSSVRPSSFFFLSF